MYDYILSKQAEEDISSAMQYITEVLCNRHAANALFEKIEATIAKACEFPLSYPTSEYYYIHDINIRHAVINNYVLFYEIKDSDQTIAVLRFLMARMNFENIPIK